MQEENIKVTVIVGDTGYKEMRTKKLREPYEPYVEIVSSPAMLLKKAHITKAPLFGTKKLLILETEMTFVFYSTLIKHIKAIKNDKVDIHIYLKERGQFQFFEDNNLKIINLRKTIKQDFEEYVREKLPNIQIEGYKQIVRKLGYSPQRLEIYLTELKKYNPITSVVVKKIIKERHLPPIHEILYKIICGEKSGYNDYIDLCERYSERWVIDNFKTTLNKVVKAKKKLIQNDKTFWSKKENKKISLLISRTNILDIIYLKNLLSYNMAPIEVYYKQIYRNKYKPNTVTDSSVLGIGGE